MCLTPVTITREIAGRWYMNNVPCNKCLECIKDRQNAYIVRSLEENKKRGSMVFFTLTYSPEAVPMTDEFEVDEDTGEYFVTGELKTLRRADVSKWLKTFKRYWSRKGESLDFSYMISGEYGPKTQRPHYHGLIFGLDQTKVNDLMWRWKTQKGFVVFKYVPALKKDVECASRYCAKYMIKDDEWNYVPAGAEKPRIMTSQFYGMPSESVWKVWHRKYLALDIADYDPSHPVFANKDDMSKVVHEIIKRRTYDLGHGRKCKLPNYYKRKLFYEKVAGKERATAIQHMVTYHIQCDADKAFKEELHNLADIYDYGDYAQALDRYNMVHDDSKYYRAKMYAETNARYMAKSAF